MGDVACSAAGFCDAHPKALNARGWACRLDVPRDFVTWSSRGTDRTGAMLYVGVAMVWFTNHPLSLMMRFDAWLIWNMYGQSGLSYRGARGRMQARRGG